MIKVQRISDFQHQFSFTNQQEQFSIFFARFLESDLGKIYTAIPWEDLVRRFKIKDSHKGPTSIFSPRGKLALMILKHYACCSDKRLFELLKKAYIDARYKMKEYHITKADLEYLSHRVSKLGRLAKEICLDKIEQIGMNESTS